MKQKKKNCTNKNTLLDIDVSDVFVVKNSKKRAFIEQFNYSSVNFTQKNLGIILGFFIVRDNSNTSENIVNFLASEVKKQYFAPTQKSIEDKFESTLHHINRILEEIANIGNVEWLGNIDGTVCVVNNRSIHFSITGNAHVLLLRDNILIDIGDGLASPEATQYPLKTFVDISSGDICPGDKIIITSQELLDLISFKELQKNALRFGQKNFIQFIKTALTNECSIAATTIIDVTQREKPETIVDPQDKKVPNNIFSADAFEDEDDTLLSIIDESIDIDELMDKKPEEYTDPRTGHIHIQGSDEIIEEPSAFLTVKGKCLDIFDTSRETVTKKLRLLSKRVSRNKKDDKSQEEDATKDAKVNLVTTPSLPQKTKTVMYRICSITKDVAKNTSIHCIDVITNIKKSAKHDNISSTDTTLDTSTEKKHSFLPRMQHITKLWNKMSNQTKLFAISVLIFIIIVPLIFSKLSQSAKEETDNTDVQQEEIQEEIQEESNQQLPEETISQNTINDPTTLLNDPATISTIILNNKQIGITKDAVILFDGTNKKNYFTPENAGEIMLATPMNDLDFVFLLTTKDQLYSFSPTEKNFVNQEKISTLDHTNITALETYMTYLYTMNDSMITRYSRKENGFDNGKDWLKEKTDLSDTTTFAIDDYIYTAKNGQIIKFTKGKKASFSQDPDIKNASLIYITEDTKFMWILDTQNKILFKTEKSNGKKIGEYIHDKFGNANSFAIHEKDAVATIATTDQILSFKL